ncbi:unnamed protein product [marine sediment metagenome]|uniref:Uncharacterized protein n=1 Tax=marine sediment metagenome TaxID=412755 RepID=X0U1Z4_9ZZZZ
MDIEKITENLYHMIVDDLKVIDFPTTLKKIIEYHVREGINGRYSFE